MILTRCTNNSQIKPCKMVTLVTNLIFQKTTKEVNSNMMGCSKKFSEAKMLAKQLLTMMNSLG